MSDEIAGAARAGLAKNIAGKAKEMVGAVIGNDSLVAEGRLNQAEAMRRKEAAADEALARAEREAAVEELGEIAEETDAQKAAVLQRTQEQDARRDADAARVIADVRAQAQTDKEREQARADHDADADRRRVQVEEMREEIVADNAQAAAEREYARRTVEADATAEAAERARKAAERLDSQAP
jgi:uncharacterized protein YjbJ (UPF0337 family)